MLQPCYGERSAKDEGCAQREPPVREERRRLGYGLERPEIRIAHDTDDLTGGMDSAVSGTAMKKRVRQVLPDRVLPWEVAVCQRLVDHEHPDSVEPVLVVGKRAPAQERHPDRGKKVWRDGEQPRHGPGTRCGRRGAVDCKL